jgi:hypothetical protein
LNHSLEVQLKTYQDYVIVILLHLVFGKLLRRLHCSFKTYSNVGGRVSPIFFAAFYPGIGGWTFQS